MTIMCLTVKIQGKAKEQIKRSDFW